jgi:hypothetical protein
VHQDPCLTDRDGRLGAVQGQVGPAQPEDLAAACA